MAFVAARFAVLCLSLFCAGLSTYETKVQHSIVAVVGMTDTAGFVA